MREINYILVTNLFYLSCYPRKIIVEKLIFASEHEIEVADPAKIFCFENFVACDLNAFFNFNFLFYLNTILIL
jgi:hypothetical protein